MNSPTGAGVPRVMAAIAAGRARELDGRGVNCSYRLMHAGRPLSVKVHCPDRSSDVERRRIQSVDAALRGTDWYPPVIDMGMYAAEQPHLVVIRPFVPGERSADARGHIGRLLDVISDLSVLAPSGDAVGEDLTWDYATPWLTDAEHESRYAHRIRTGEWAHLARAVAVHAQDLLDSAERLTRAERPVVHHGDLHGGNLIHHGSRPLTVVDWDETGFSRRPADAAKALWLSCRRGRGDFVMDAAAVRHFLLRMHAQLHIPYAAMGDVAKLGAIWFLPRNDHVALIERRNPAFGPWYLDWVSRFWSRFEQNLQVISDSAAILEGNEGRRP
ncbi:phosphotransferase [Streptomyces anulatus]|uniref:phosphotransferase n=1 Tax=Streptomyces anulatus TaxID=1892 RepID=UPI0036CEB821